MNVSSFLLRFVSAFASQSGCKSTTSFQSRKLFRKLFFKISLSAKRQDLVIFAEGKGKTLYPIPQIFFS
jgi:hypothetical protein